MIRFVAIALMLVVPLVCNSAQSSPRKQQVDASIQTLLSRAQALRQSGDSAEARTLYRKVTKLAPSNAESWWYLGLIDYEADKYRDAMAAFQRLTTLDSKYAEAWAMRGLCEFHAATPATAISSFLKAVR